MAKVIVTSTAETDFTESLSWYAEQDLTAAYDFDQEFERVIAELRVDPLKSSMYDDPYRYVPMRRSPFRVIFRVDKEEVVVVAIAHASRSPDYWKRR